MAKMRRFVTALRQSCLRNLLLEWLADREANIPAGKAEWPLHLRHFVVVPVVALGRLEFHLEHPAQVELSNQVKLVKGQPADCANRASSQR